MATLALAITKGLDFGPVQITCLDANGDPVALAGWKAYAQARTNPGRKLILDFSPVIADDDAIGLITFPALTWQDTDDLQAGEFQWDMILENPEGIRMQPEFDGTLTISGINTQVKTPSE